MEKEVFQLYKEKKNKNKYDIEHYDYCNSKVKEEIKKIDELIFKEKSADNFYDVKGYFIRSASSSIVSYLLYEVLENKTIYISSLGTLPAFEGEGRASQLIQYLKSNYTDYTLKLKVDTFHDVKYAEKLIDFYKSKGFEIVYSSVNMEFKPFK